MRSILVAASSSVSDQPVRLTALAAAVFLIALALTAWRGIQIFGEDARVAQTAPHALTQTLEALTGEGAVRLTQGGAAPGTRTLFILRDRYAEGSAADLKSIAVQASGFDLKAGDRVIVRDVDFAVSHAAPSPAQLGELAALVVLVFASGALALLSLRPMPAARAPAYMPPAPMIDTAPQPPAQKQIRTPQGAAETINRDPARAADVVRSWMMREGGA